MGTLTAACPKDGGGIGDGPRVLQELYNLGPSGSYGLYTAVADSGATRPTEGVGTGRNKTAVQEPETEAGASRGTSREPRNTMKNLKYVASLIAGLGLSTLGVFGQPAGAESRGPTERGPGRPRLAFSELDLNHDGSVTEQEFDQARAALRGRGRPEAAPEERPGTAKVAAEDRKGDSPQADLADRPSPGERRGPGLRRQAGPGRGDGERRGPGGYGRPGRSAAIAGSPEAPRYRRFAEHVRRPAVEGMEPRGRRWHGGLEAGEVCPRCGGPVAPRGRDDDGGPRRRMPRG